MCGTDFECCVGILYYVEARFIKFCENDKFCSSKLSKEIKAHGGMASAIRALYNRLDAAEPGQDKCADLMRDLSIQPETPSRTLRNLLGWRVYTDPARILVPAILHRVYRCNAKDVAFLKSVFGYSSPAPSATTSLAAYTATMSDPVTVNSQFLSSLIIASELWATPSPSWADEMKFFDEGLFSAFPASRFDYTCFFRGNFSDPMCEHLITANPTIDFPKLKTTPFVYKPDKYWKKYASIPSHASVMVINGGLDFQTASLGGTVEYEGLQGEGDKILVEFDTGGHGAGVLPATASDKTNCGFRIISSYVLGGGNVKKVETSCMKKLPGIDFADLRAITTANVAVKTADELYDSV